MNNIIVRSVNMHKSYFLDKRELKVLQGINLELERSSFNLILGPSGGGKSTLLHLLGALDRPTSGEVYVNGDPLSQLSEKRLSHLRNQKIGFIFQFYHHLPELNALENVCLPLWLAKRKVNLESVKSLIAELGLSDKMHHRPQELSGGEQQRFAIARALVNEPDILLADEPTGNLDSSNGHMVFDLLRKLNQEKYLTVIMVSHNQDFSENVDRVIHIKDGFLI